MMFISVEYFDAQIFFPLFSGEIGILEMMAQRKSEHHKNEHVHKEENKTAV